MIYLVLVLAFFLRLINLNQSLWLDEAIQAWAASSFNLNNLLTQFTPTDVHPPLSYLISFFTGKLIGFSEFSLRLPSVLFGIITVFMIFKLAKLLKLKNPVLPAVLLATSGLHLYYSQEGRMYSLATFLVVLSVYYLVKGLTKPKNLILFSLITLLSFYTHYYTFFMIPVYLLINFISKTKHKLKPTLALVVSLLSFMPWLPTLIQQLKGGLTASLSNSTWASTVGGLNLKALGLIPIKFLIGRISFENNLVYASIVIPPLLLSAYLLFILLKKRSPQANTLLSWLFVPILIAILISIKIPVLGFHRFLFILPAFYLLLSLGINQLKKPVEKIVITFFILFNLLTSGLYLFNLNHHRENWKGLASNLIVLNQSNVPVAILAPVKTPLQYYYAGEIISYTDIKKTFNQPELWLVPYAEPIFDPNLTTRQTLESLGFKSNFEKHFRGNLTLVKYSL